MKQQACWPSWVKISEVLIARLPCDTDWSNAFWSKFCKTFFICFLTQKFEQKLSKSQNARNSIWAYAVCDTLEVTHGSQRDFETSNFPVPTKARDRGTSEWRIERRIPLGTGVFAVKQLVFKFNGAMDAIGGFSSRNWCQLPFPESEFLIIVHKAIAVGICLWSLPFKLPAFTTQVVTAVRRTTAFAIQFIREI